MRAIGRWRVTLAAGLLASVMVGAPGAAQGPSPSTSTPEGAVRIYLDAFKERDLDALMSVSAANPVAEQVDFTAYVERLQAWLPFQAPAPATDPFLVDLNRVQQVAQLLGQTRMLTYGLLTDAQLDGSTVAPVDAAWATSFMSQLDLTRLDGLEVDSVVEPDPELMAGERYREVMAKQAAVYGADEMTERVATVSLEGRDWLVGFTLMRFGDAWHIASQNSVIAGLPATGAPTPLDG
jgi:hypothetical protein